MSEHKSDEYEDHINLNKLCESYGHVKRKNLSKLTKMITNKSNFEDHFNQLKRLVGEELSDYESIAAFDRQQKKYFEWKAYGGEIKHLIFVVGNRQPEKESPQQIPFADGYEFQELFEKTFLQLWHCDEKYTKKDFMLYEYIVNACHYNADVKKLTEHFAVGVNVFRSAANKFTVKLHCGEPARVRMNVLRQLASDFDTFSHVEKPRAKTTFGFVGKTVYVAIKSLKRNRFGWRATNLTPDWLKSKALALVLSLLLLIPALLLAANSIVSRLLNKWVIPIDAVRVDEPITAYPQPARIEDSPEISLPPPELAAEAFYESPSDTRAKKDKRNSNVSRKDESLVVDLLQPGLIKQCEDISPEQFDRLNTQIAETEIPKQDEINGDLLPVPPDNYECDGAER